MLRYDKQTGKLGIWTVSVQNKVLVAYFLNESSWECKSTVNIYIFASYGVLGIFFLTWQAADDKVK